MAYVDLGYVQNVGTVPTQILAAFDEANPGSFAAIAESVSRMFDARLHKRYNTPFAEPYPEAIRFHVAQVVSYQVWIKVGYNPGSAQDEGIKTARDDALAWLKDAADSQDGTVELPVRETPATGDASAISRSRPLSYNEASPYVWTRIQASRARGGG